LLKQPWISSKGILSVKKCYFLTARKLASSDQPTTINPTNCSQIFTLAGTLWKRIVLFFVTFVRITVNSPFRNILQQAGDR
jgi:hypothetical protein